MFLYCCCSITNVVVMGFPKWCSGKESTCNAGDAGLIPGSGRSPKEGNGSPLQYACLDNPMDRGTWRPTVHGVVAKSHPTLLRLNGLQPTRLLFLWDCTGRHTEVGCQVHLQGIFLTQGLNPHLLHWQETHMLEPANICPVKVYVCLFSFCSSFNEI